MIPRSVPILLLLAAGCGEDHSARLRDSSKQLPPPPTAVASATTRPTPARTPFPSINGRSLFGVENPSAELLAEKLRHPDWRIRYYAARWLHGRGDSAVSAVPALISALRDPNDAVRREAASTLGELRSVRAEIVPALLEMLQASPPAEREAALESLLKLGVTPDMAPALLAELDKDDGGTRTREVATAALAQISDAEGMVVRLAGLLRDRSRGVSGSAEKALLRLGPRAREALPQLIAAIEEPNGPARLAAAAVLGSMGPTAGPAVPSLFGLLEDDQPDVRKAAATAIRAIRSRAPSSVSP